jgi:hypothetical protein
MAALTSRIVPGIRRRPPLRYRRKLTILTTNLEYDQWHQLFGNKDLTETLLSRLRH